MSNPQKTAPLKVILDGDPGLDDAVAWLLALASPEVQVLGITAIAAFRPRRWRGAILPQSATVRFDVLDPDKRPVMADADSRGVDSVLWVEVSSENSIRHRLLFDPGHGLEERLIREQFV